MTLERIAAESNSAGTTGANQHATETWEGELNGKHFQVVIDSCAAPIWSGDDLDIDECTEVMRELSERSGL